DGTTSRRDTLPNKMKLTVSKEKAIKEYILELDSRGFRRHRPKALQPGTCEWVTTILAISALGYVIPPFIIYKGKNHLSAWYQETWYTTSIAIWCL
ncbi:hypothetical protein K469DRAFT_543555, partial [Zopfia rhizophila CBS 207.26]